MILIILSISSFEINKSNPFPAYTVTLPRIVFLSKLYITDEIDLAANCGKILLVKETVCFISVFLPNLPMIITRNPLDLIISNNELY